jgi:hypothetical protein
MGQYGNKLEVVSKLLEVVKYIEDYQNSPDLQAYKALILKMTSTMINTAINNANEENTVDTNVVENVKESCGDCSDQSCGFNPEPNVKPQYNLQDTIEKIKKELETE